MGFARQVANRVVFVDAGQIVEVNEPAAFFDAPTVSERRRTTKSLRTRTEYPCARIAGEPDACGCLPRHPQARQADAMRRSSRCRRRLRRRFERLQHEAGFVRQAISDFAIPDRRALRVDTPVFDERTRAEMTNAETAEHGFRGSIVTPAEITRSKAPGICVPAGSSSVKRALVNARSASTVIHGASRA